jgi:hypothetical protein
MGIFILFSKNSEIPSTTGMDGKLRLVEALTYFP